MAETQQSVEMGALQHVAIFANAMDARPELIMRGDERLAEQALLAVKEIFAMETRNMRDAEPHLGPFLESIKLPTTIQLRSAIAKGSKADPDPSSPSAEIPQLLPTFEELTTEGLDPEQIWQQIEIQGKPIVEAIKAVIDENPEDDEDGPGPGTKNDSHDEHGDDDEESLDLESLSPEELQKLMDGYDDDSDLMSDEEDEEDEEDSDEDDESGSEDDAVDFYDEDDANAFGSSDEDGDEEEDEAEDEDEDDEEEDLDLESDEELEDGSGEEQDDDVEMEDESEEEDDPEAAGLSLPGPSYKRRHPELDDDFFRIDEFNRLTEEAEAGRVTSGRLGGSGDDDEEEDEAFDGDISSIMLRGAPEEDSIMYSDFFEPPRPQYVPGQSKGKDKAKGTGKKTMSTKDAKGKGKAKGKARFADEEENGETEEEAGEDEERGVMGRVKMDLFDDEDEEESAPEQALSTFEKRQRALAEQIAELESEAIGPKDWTLLGEATSRARPENSLLEENLDFDQMGKVVPVITEEVVMRLEDMIKLRIVENRFDSPVRVRAYEPTPFLPSRYFELQDTQSSKSLAQIYEEEYQTAAAGGKTKDPRDEKLKKEHDEITRLWDEVCYKLDALSSLNFVPKQPKAQISTISNLPTTTMETALPPTSSAATLLAPQEVFAAPSASGLVSRSELTPEEAQKSRQKARKAKQAQKHKLDDMAALYGSKKRKSAKEEKDEALKSLVKSGKGVTVVGKGDKASSRRQNGAGGPDGHKADGSRLKL